jgi:hypothetical protein
VTGAKRFDLEVFKRLKDEMINAVALPESWKKNVETNITEVSKAN